MSTEEIIRATRYTVVGDDLYVNIEDVARLLDRCAEISVGFPGAEAFRALARALGRGPKATDTGAPSVS